ncbi:hypothetical protein R2601_19694 [Salipiger bermudensis HTCC2601]|uniref:Transcriptional coactivator p15 (PC4) C-terminal domain-containing protein n=2 Tax=Salipiger TaxID=263377 RepID=Q0FU05_SALBH|nr:hypothetical protein R2601_19694 [Salipiger bermudensis HTCC2601]
MVVLPKNSREELRVCIDTFKGHVLLNLRIWYLGKDGDMHPTRKGVALRAESLPDIIAALTSLQMTFDAKDSA